MTYFQRAVCVLLSLCFFAVLAVSPEPFFPWENVYRQLPLYCFLEKEAGSISQREDPETSERIVADNAAYLGALVQKENREPESALTQTPPAPQKEDKPKEQSQPEPENDPQNTSPPESTNRKTTDKNSTAKTPANNAPANNTPTRAASGKEPTDSAPAEEEGTDGASGEEAGLEPETTEAAQEAASVQPQPLVDLSPEVLSDYDYVLNQFFILDPNTATNPEQINASDFLAKDLTIEKKDSGPQILIYHSHSQEAFADSREGEPEDTVVGVGNYLTELLTETYGYQVLHITETFDIIDGELDRSKSYDYAREYLDHVLAENPSIEVIIDLHRDGVPEDRRLVTEINGKETAQIMFYNGLSYTVNNGPVDYLPNPYIQDNLAFSFQLEYQAALYYPKLYRGIYLAGLRYNLHLRPRTLLLEAGAQTNTVQEVKNAMEPFADILNRVLTGT